MLSFIKKDLGKREKTELDKLNELKTQMIENLRQAHEEWQDNEKFFQSVSDPDLVDYAIYETEASKLKYIYLLKKIKEWDKDISEELRNQQMENISVDS
jgi:hypothetical protein